MKSSVYWQLFDVHKNVEFNLADGKYYEDDYREDLDKLTLHCEDTTAIKWAD